MTTRAAIAALRSESAARRGLTLIELMVVMVILTILSSLMLAGLLVARERSRQVKTLSTIRKLSELILPYYEEYETRRPMLDTNAVSRILADGTKRNRELVTQYKRIALRRLMALELPDRASDVTVAFDGVFDPKVDGQSTPLTEIPPVTRRYARAIQGVSNLTSADLLHLIVTRGVVADPDMIAHFRDDEVADTNGNGLKEFVDGWGTPIAFKRWPTGFDSPLQSINGSLSDVDPLISNSGHRLLPLIYAAGRDKSYDIMADPPTGPSWSYREVNYDPFAAALRVPAGAATVRGEVFLVSASIPVPGSSDSVEVFTAVRHGGGSLPSGAFQTVGSPRDTGSSSGTIPDGRLDSADNIHNHDLRL